VFASSVGVICFAYFKMDHASVSYELFKMSAVEVLEIITDSCLLEIAIFTRKEKECCARQMNRKQVYWSPCYFYTILLDVRILLHMFHNAF
jgi:hypothetical protein